MVGSARAIDKDRADEQDQGFPHAGVQLQATERFGRATAPNDRRTAWTIEIRQEHGPRQHDSGAVSGLLRAHLHSLQQHKCRRQLEAGQEVH